MVLIGGTVWKQSLNINTLEYKHIVLHHHRTRPSLRPRPLPDRNKIQCGRDILHHRRVGSGTKTYDIS